MATSQLGQHKRLAMGESVGFAKGGPVLPPSGKKESPLTVAKRNNGIPGFKAGGKVGKKDKC